MFLIFKKRLIKCLLLSFILGHNLATLFFLL